MFDATVSYQIYCSPTCRNEATKVKIANKQALNKRKKELAKIENVPEVVELPFQCTTTLTIVQIAR